MLIFLFIVIVVIVIGLAVFKRIHEMEPPIFPKQVNYVLYFILFGLFLSISFNQIFFYADPGFKYHVRTVFGDEKMVSDVGFNTYWAGKKTTWKNAMSITADSRFTVSESSGEEDNGLASATMAPLDAVFLDQVNAKLSGMARFRLPSDEESFLKMTREYRTPDNLIRSSLIPAFLETMQANTAIMSAEDYYSGDRNQFSMNFENQLKNGLFIVKREEEVKSAHQNLGTGTANASLGENQEKYGDDKKLQLNVVKVLDEETGLPKRKIQGFTIWGIEVVEARITFVEPNIEFSERMKLKQKAAADRAIAREQRTQEVEQKLLVEAKGQREVAESKAAALVYQIEKTTGAETDKQLALTEANQQKERAEIDRQTSVIRLAQAKLDAEKQQVLADAEAYEKRVLLEADNALDAKLKAEVSIQEVWAAAFAKRNVPHNVFSSGGNGDLPTGGNTELQQILQIMTMQMADRLDYDRSAKVRD